MHDFFRPWRRKIGVLTLILASVLAAAWVHSQDSIDLFMINWFGPQLNFVSGPGGFKIVSGVISRIRGTIPAGELVSRKTELSFNPEHPFHGDEPFIWRNWRHSSLVIYSVSSLGETEIPLIRYHFITLPLTLISAWLLLSTSRRLRVIVQSS